MRDELFEWDDPTVEQNARKHGLDFWVARLAFSDPHLVERPDRRRDYGEPRFLAVGMVRGIVLSVAFTYRADRVRIIPARRANRNERR